MIWAYNRQFADTSITKSIAIMPSNLYGKNDNYDPKNSHVIPGLIHKFHVAKKNKDKEITSAIKNILILLITKQIF